MNSIKKSGTEGHALQVTRPARSAGLVTEDSNGVPKRMAEVYVIAVGETILVFDEKEISDKHRAEIVSRAINETGDVGVAGRTKITTAGNGYQVQLPKGVVADAGFAVDMQAACHGVDGMLIIHHPSSSSAGIAAHRKAQTDSTAD